MTYLIIPRILKRAIPALAVLVATTTLEAAATPGVVPPNPTYGLWGATWWQWVFSRPANFPPNPANSHSNPLLSEGAVDCSYGQLGAAFGKVWFLAGSFSGGPISRSCTVPMGTWLFFPILNVWIDNIDVSPPLTIAQLKSQNDATIKTVQELHASIDGLPVPNLFDYRGTFAPFFYVVPRTDNMLHYLFHIQVPGKDWPTTFVYPAASDGYWLMLEPLSPGQHNLRFGGTFAGGFSLDVIYQITVVPGDRF